MRPMLKATIALLVVLVGFYAVITMLKGIAMVRTGGAVGVLLGLAVLVIPLLGLALVLRIREAYGSIEEDEILDIDARDSERA